MALAKRGRNEFKDWWKPKQGEENTTDYEWFRNTKAYKYCKDVSEDKIRTNIYVKKQCNQILEMIDNPNSRFFKEYYLSETMIKRVIFIVRRMNFATGEFAGQPCLNYIAGFQWVILFMCYGVFRRDNPLKRRFEKAAMLISRKNAKTWICSTFMICALLFEPEYSQTYAAANSREQATILYAEIKKTLEMSPELGKYFKITSSEIKCLNNDNTLVPISAEARNLDGKLASVAVVDEFGAARDSAVMDSLQTSMLSTINRLLFTISTAYPYPINPMRDMIDYGKKVLDGIVEDDRFFLLHYALDSEDEKEWWIEENWIKSNPLQATSQLGMEFLRGECKMALELPSKKASFMTKNLNIWIDGDDSEVYIPIDDVRKCKIDKFNWEGREVYLGLDMSQTTDNTSLAMVTYDYERRKFVSKVWGFMPTDNVENKIKVEKVNYHLYKEMGNCFYCGDKVIDYLFVENFILDLENKYGVMIKGLGYDRYNCIATANRLDNHGISTIEIKQHSSVLHPATKLLKEMVLTNRFEYEKNGLLEVNFANAREVLDTNLNGYVSKRKSNGKVDMVVSLINAMRLWHEEDIDGSVYETDEREMGFLVI